MKGRASLKLLILNYEYPPLGGGAGVISYFHAISFARLGHKVTVLTCSDNNSFYKEQAAENLEVIRLPSRRKHHFKSGTYEKLDWINHAEKYLLKNDISGFDACIAHFSIPGGWVARKVKRVKGLPYFVISHGQDVPWFYPRQMFFYHLLTAPLIRRILVDAERLWVQSEMMLENGRRFLKHDPAKVQKIPNGCDPLVYYPEKKPPVENGLNLFFAGRITRQKRPEKLIETAEILKRKGVQFKLTIAGDGPLKQKLMAMVAQRNLQNDVLFTGWISKKEVREYYARSHILLAPSEAEGMSITILEALFSGLYVLTTPVSGNPDLITEGVNGALVENQPEAFAEAIQQYLKRPRDASLTGFQQKFMEIYDWTSITKLYEKQLLDAIC